MESQLKRLIELFEEFSITNDTKHLNNLEYQIQELFTKFKNDLKTAGDKDVFYSNAQALQKIIEKISKKQNSRLYLINEFKEYLEKNKVVKN